MSDNSNNNSTTIPSLIDSINPFHYEIDNNKNTHNNNHDKNTNQINNTMIINSDVSPEQALAVLTAVRLAQESHESPLTSDNNNLAQHLEDLPAELSSFDLMPHSSSQSDVLQRSFELFCLLDRNGDKKIDLEELELGLRLFSNQVTSLK